MTSTTFGFKFFKSVLLFSLSLTLIFSACTKKDTTPPPPPPDKTALQAKVAAAQTLNSSSFEGTKPTQFEVGSKAPFLVIINAALAVIADPNATQTAVTNATAQVQAAIDTYNTHFIKEIAAVNLIGFWKFNGNPADSSGNGNNGVVTAGHAFFGAGTPTLTADRFARANSAYHFDKGGNIDVPYKTSLNPQQMSISLWAKWSSTGRTINTDTYTFVAMNRWNGYKFQLQGGHLPFYTVKVVKAIGDTTIHDRDDAGIALTENTWTHVVVTFIAGTMNFYLNGDLVKSWTNTPGNALTLTNPLDFVIGQDLPTNKYLTVDATGNLLVDYGGFFTGDMDDVMFYNVALDGPQVKSIYNNQKTL